MPSPSQSNIGVCNLVTWAWRPDIWPEWKQDTWWYLCEHLDNIKTSYEIRINQISDMKTCYGSHDSSVPGGSTDKSWENPLIVFTVVCLCVFFASTFTRWSERCNLCDGERDYATGCAAQVGVAVKRQREQLISGDLALFWAGLFRNFTLTFRNFGHVFFTRLTADV